MDRHVPASATIDTAPADSQPTPAIATPNTPCPKTLVRFALLSPSSGARANIHRVAHTSAARPSFHCRRTAE